MPALTTLAPKDSLTYRALDQFHQLFESKQSTEFDFTVLNWYCSAVNFVYGIKYEIERCFHLSDGRQQNSVHWALLLLPKLHNTQQDYFASVQICFTVE